MRIIFFLILLSVIVFSGGCKKKDLPDPVDNTVTAPVFYYKANIGGTPVYLEEDKNGYANGSNRVQGGINFNEDYQSTFMSTVDIEKNYYAVGVTKKYSEEPTCDQVKTTVTKGIYPYIDLNSDDGALVEMLDENGDIWTSVLGTQTNSSFEIVELIDNKVDIYGLKIAKIKFSCILYDINGNSREVKDGEVYGRIINCL